MKGIFNRTTGYAVLISALILLLGGCYERYPFFIQQPEFSVSRPSDGQDYLYIHCVDENAIIRYTVDGSEPDSHHGLVYNDPILLGAYPFSVKAAAYRTGYPAGPVVEFNYDPQSM